MKRLGKMGIILILSFVVVNISFADSHKDKSHYKKLLGTWLVTNETVDSTYDGTIGQITFYDDYLTMILEDLRLLELQQLLKMYLAIFLLARRIKVYGKSL